MRLPYKAMKVVVRSLQQGELEVFPVKIKELVECNLYPYRYCTAVIFLRVGSYQKCDMAMRSRLHLLGARCLVKKLSVLS